MTLADSTHILTLLCLVFLLGGGAHMYLQSRNWTLPVQSARVQVLEDETRVLRGNLKRLDRDTSEWHHQMMEAQDAILRELQSIQRNGAKEHPLEEKMVSVEERLLDVEQMLSSLPCAPNCPIPEAKK